MTKKLPEYPQTQLDNESATEFHERQIFWIKTYFMSHMNEDEIADLIRGLWSNTKHCRKELVRRSELLAKIRDIIDGQE